MGAWGPAIFSDDVAADVRDLFTDHAAAGLSPEEATQQTVSDSSDLLEDEQDCAVFWLALAATQWKLGRLLDHVRDKAIAIIDSGENLHSWEEAEPAELRKRVAHLAKLRKQLLAPPPPPKRLRRRVKSTTDLSVGDVADFRMDDGSLFRFCVLHLWSDRGGTYQNICFLGPGGGAFEKLRVDLEETLGPHFTMLGHEPVERLSFVARGVSIPEQTAEAFRAWNRIAVRGHACHWKELSESLKKLLPALRWA